MSENEKQLIEDPVLEADNVEEEVFETKSDNEGKKSSFAKYVTAFVIVALILVGVLYLLEKEGRASTGIFASLIESQEASAVVAVVNGEEITNSELDTSIQQFSQAAKAQGVDVASPEAIGEIKGQALDVLVNTKLLKQEALKQGIVVTEEQAAERLETIQIEIGGAEVLADRMATLGIEEEQLHQDIKDELLIKKLLDTVFDDTDISVTEEEITEVYDNAGGEGIELPALEEVRGQIEAQIIASKEQVAIEDYLDDIREVAEIVIK